MEYRGKEKNCFLNSIELHKVQKFKPLQKPKHVFNIVLSKHNYIKMISCILEKGHTF